MIKRRYGALAVSALFVFLASVLQLGSGSFFGFTVDVALATVIVLTPFLTLLETAALTVGAYALIESQLSIGAEQALFYLLPVAAYGALRVLPWQSGAAVSLVVVLGIACFYGVLDYRLAVGNPSVLMDDIAASLAWGIFVFVVMHRHFVPIAGRRRAGV